MHLKVSSLWLLFIIIEITYTSLTILRNFADPTSLRMSKKIEKNEREIPYNTGIHSFHIPIHLLNANIIGAGILALTLYFFPIISAYADAAHCLTCHSSKHSSDESLAIPRLAGQHPEYIVKQLENFHAAMKADASQRTSKDMAHLMVGIPREKWAAIAKILSSQNCGDYGLPDIETLTPNLCASCHGPRGISDDPEIPNLAGQSGLYMFHQYQNFRAQHMTNFPKEKSMARLHPVMGPLSAQISERVILIINYYSKLPCREEPLR